MESLETRTIKDTVSGGPGDLTWVHFLMEGNLGVSQIYKK